MPGSAKAAVLLVTIGLDRAAEVFRHLDSEEVEALSLAMAKLRAVPSTTTETIVEEAVQTVVAERYLAEAEIAMRVATMGETAPEVVAAVEGVMKDKLSNVISQEFTAAGGVKSLAEILNSTDRTTERNVLDSMSEADPELADEVRRLLFTFEDIRTLDDRSIQLVLKEVDQKDLAIALRGVSDDVSHRIFANMSERGAELLREEIEFQPPQRRRIVEEAQGRIVGVVRRLEEAGAVVLSRGSGGEDELM